MEELAQVYGNALFEVASENGVSDDVREQLGQFADELDQNRDLQIFLFSPYFSSQEKKEGIGRIVEGADERFLNFLELLAERHRMPAIFRIRRAYDALWREENKLLPVTVTSAVDLDEGLVEGLGKRIEEQTGKKVELTSKVDADVLGGLVLQVGNMVLDASIRTKLAKLRREVAKAT